MSAIARFVASIFAQKASAAVQRSQPMQTLAQSTARLERQGVAGASAFIVAAGEEIAKDVQQVWSRLMGSSSSSNASADDTVPAQISSQSPQPAAVSDSVKEPSTNARTEAAGNTKK